jgi:hypothetical protein
MEQKNEIKRKFCTKTIDFRTLVSKEVIFSYKGRYWGDTYLISRDKTSQNKHSFSTLLIIVSSVTSDKKNFAPNFEQPPNLKIIQQDSHKFQQSS